MTTQLEHRQETALLSEKSIVHTKEQLDLLTKLVQTVLKDGADYGKIPGTDRPTLLKPGADNVSAAFNLYPEPLVLHETVDPDKGYIAYTIGVKLISRMDGQIKSQGMGQCNSYETKYRYRWEGKGEDRKRVINQDPLEQANTILKMAEKRAYVDAVMKLPGVARFFTQDLEDYPVATGAEQGKAAEYGICDIHKVAYFKTGKMRSPAHRTDDGGWCNKPAEKPAASSAPRVDLNTGEVLPVAPAASALLAVARDVAGASKVDHWGALDENQRRALREMGYTPATATATLGAPLDEWLAADKLRTTAEAMRLLREAKAKGAPA